MSWTPVEMPSATRTIPPAVSLRRRGRTATALYVNAAAMRESGLKKGDLVTLERQNGEYRVRRVLEGEKGALGCLSNYGSCAGLFFAAAGTALKLAGFGLGSVVASRIYEGAIVFDPEPLRHCDEIVLPEPPRKKMGRPRKAVEA